MKTIIFFDIESTGLDVTKDRIIQLSLVKTDLKLNIIEKKKLLLNNCGVPIQKDAEKAHGISEEKLVGLPSFGDYSLKIYNYLNDCDYIAGYNIKGFDIQILFEEFYRSGIKLGLTQLLSWIPKPSIDCCVIFKNREPRTLAGALKFYCGKDIEGAHDAENDVLTTIDVLLGQIEKYYFNIPEVGEEENPDNIITHVISESKYPDEDKRLSFDGKIILNDDGIAVWGNFGKNKNKQVLDDLGYCEWFLSADFPSQSKNVLRSLLNR